MRIEYLLFAYGSVTLTVAAAAQVTTGLLPWSLSGGTVVVILGVHIVALYATRELLWDHRTPIFKPSRPVVFLIRVVLATLAIYVGSFAFLAFREPSEWHGQSLVVGGFMLTSAAVAAISGFGLDASVGRIVAAIVRIPFDAATAVSRYDRGRDIARYRRARRARRIDARPTRNGCEAEIDDANTRQ